MQVQGKIPMQKFHSGEHQQHDKTVSPVKKKQAIKEPTSASPQKKKQKKPKANNEIEEPVLDANQLKLFNSEQDRY